MRKIAANYIMPVSSPPLKNGVVVLDDDGSILELIDTGGRLRESSKLEFYKGIITPGFVLPCYRAADQAGSLTDAEFREMDHMLLRQGIKAIGIIERKAGHFANKKESAVTYHTILELCPGQEDEEFEVYQEGIDLITNAWNEFNQLCSLSCCASSLMETDMAKYILQFAARHQLVIPLENYSRWSLPKQMARLQKHMERLSEELPESIKRNVHLVLVQDRADLPAVTHPEPVNDWTTFHIQRPGEKINLLQAMLLWQEMSSAYTLLDVIPAYTIQAARAIFEDGMLGSLDPGKKPGLIQVSGTEPGTYKLTGKSAFRVLA